MAEDRPIFDLGVVRDLVTAPGLVGFVTDDRQLQRGDAAKVGKNSPPVPPGPSRD